MRKLLEAGGVFAAVVLIAFGIGAIVLGANGRSTVNDNLAAQKIVGSPDMTPTAIKTEVTKAGLNPATLPIPTCSIAGQQVDNGASARCFAQYMNLHALEATGGKVFAEMPRFASADGKGTNDEAKALKGESGQPVDNPARNVWVTETALTSALNSSYMATQMAMFGIVVGVALLLSGLGFAILAAGGALRNRDNAMHTLLTHREHAEEHGAPKPA